MRAMTASRKRGGSRDTEEVETRLGMSGLEECLRGCVTRWESCVQTLEVYIIRSDVRMMGFIACEILCINTSISISNLLLWMVLAGYLYFPP